MVKPIGDNNMKKLIIALIMGAIVTGCVNYKSASTTTTSAVVPCDTADFVYEYEAIRAEVYDRAMDLVSCIHQIYLETPDEEREYTLWMLIEPKDRVIIENYRVPSIFVLIRALDTIDEKDCLADSFDNDVLTPYDEALKKFMEFGHYYDI